MVIDAIILNGEKIEKKQENVINYINCNDSDNCASYNCSSFVKR